MATSDSEHHAASIFSAMYIMYVFTDCIFRTDHISLYKLDLSYLCIIITNHYYMYLIVIFSFCTMPVVI